MENQLTASVRLEPDVNESINEHLGKLPTPPRKQAFINSLLRLALTMKRIPVVGQTADVTKKFSKPKEKAHA